MDGNFVKIGIPGMSCYACGEPIPPDGLVVCCPDCGAVFCRDCVPDGQIPEHDCEN